MATSAHHRRVHFASGGPMSLPRIDRSGSLGVGPLRRSGGHGLRRYGLSCLQCECSAGRAPRIRWWADYFFESRRLRQRKNLFAVYLIH